MGATKNYVAYDTYNGKTFIKLEVEMSNFNKKIVMRKTVYIEKGHKVRIWNQGESECVNYNLNEEVIGNFRKIDPYYTQAFDEEQDRWYSVNVNKSDPSDDNYYKLFYIKDPTWAEFRDTLNKNISDNDVIGTIDIQHEAIVINDFNMSTGGGIVLMFEDFKL